MTALEQKMLMLCYVPFAIICECLSGSMAGVRAAVANSGLLGPVPIMAVHNMIRIQARLALVDGAAIGKKGN